MPYDYVFLTDKLMGLFWVLVQQVCFCGVRYVYESLVPCGRSARRIAAPQAAVLVLLTILCFERELGIPFLSSLLVFGLRDFWPWTMRIALCGAMILFDALLLLYTYRIYRIYRRGLQAAGPTLAGDAALTLLVLALCAGYAAGSIRATLAHDISMDDYTWIGRAFIQISNFFYAPLEIAGAALLWRFWRAVREDAEGGND